MTANQQTIPFVPSPLGRSQMQMTDNNRIVNTPFQTPGMAGIGTDWPRRMSATMISQFSPPNAQQVRLDDLKRQRDWQHSQTVSSHNQRQQKGEEKLQNWI